MDTLIKTLPQAKNGCQSTDLKTFPAKKSQKSRELEKTAIPVLKVRIPSLNWDLSNLYFLK